MFLVQVLGVDEVLAVVGGRGGRHVVLDPLQLAVGVKVKLVPAVRVLQLTAPLGHGRLEGVEPGQDIRIVFLFYFFFFFY